MDKTSDLPLSGISVVEMGTVVLAPYAARLLMEMGASVIKVEAPGGDITRQQGPSRNPGMAALFLSCNRGKKSICLDLKQAEGVEVLRRLLRQSDIFLTNLRPRNAARLGIDHQSMREINQRLIYCAAYGFGEGGRYRGQPAYDDIIQARSGYASLYQRIEGKPRYSPSIMADKTTALYMVMGIQSALLQRERTGQGQHVEVPMFESLVHYLNVEHQAGYNFEPNLGSSGYLRMVSPQRRPHKTQDGYIAVMPHNEKDWTTFFRETGNAAFSADPQFASNENRAKNINALYDRLAEIMLTRTNAQWFEFLSSHGIPHAPVVEFDDLYTDPHLQDVGFWQTGEHPSEGTLRWPRFPVGFNGATAQSVGAQAPAAPGLGEQTQEILDMLAFSPEEQERLRRQGVVVDHGSPAKTAAQRGAPVTTNGNTHEN